MENQNNQMLDQLDQQVLSETAAENAPGSDRISAANEALLPQEEAIVAADIEKHKEFGDKNLAAGALGAARGASLGLSDQFLTKSGLVKPETLREIKERNETASLLGEAAGTIAPLVTSAGSLAPVTGAAKLGTAVEGAFARILAEKGSKGLVKNILAKTIPKAAGSAVEGSAYGLGQLLSEDALGTAELNAENALAHAGVGALLGGTVGGMFALPGSLLPIVEKNAVKLKSTATEKFGKLSDPSELALDLHGLTASQKLKLKQNSPKLVDELPQWMREKADYGLLTSDKNLLEQYAKIKETAGKKIDDIVTTIDDIGSKTPGVLPTAKSTYAKVADRIDKEIIQQFENVPGYKSQIAPIKELKTEYLNLAKQDGNITTRQIHDLRKQTDSLIKFEKEKSKGTLYQQSLWDVRNILNEEIANIAEKAEMADAKKEFGALLSDLKQANKDYHFASKMEPYISAKVSKEDLSKSLFGLKDLLAFSAGESIDKGIGAIAVVSKKIIDSDLRRKISLLSSIEKQNKATESSIRKNLESFIIKPEIKEATKYAPANILIKSRLSEDSKNRRAVTKEEGFKNISKRLNDYMADPDLFTKQISKRTMGITQAAPNTSLGIMTQAKTALDFLHSKLPKPSVDFSNQNAFIKRDYSPSQLELAKFSRYLEAAENPMSAIEDLKNGTLTSEKVETLKIIYPNIYQQMREAAMSMAQNKKETIPYTKRLQLGILLDINTDESLKSENIAALQAAHQGAQPTQQLPGPAKSQLKPGVKNLDKANRAQTEANRIAQE